jgi:hypothetical protein
MGEGVSEDKLLFGVSGGREMESTKILHHGDPEMPKRGMSK